MLSLLLRRKNEFEAAYPPRLQPLWDALTATHLLEYSFVVLPPADGMLHAIDLETSTGQIIHNDARSPSTVMRMSASLPLVDFCPEKIQHDLFQVRRVNQTAKTILNNLPVKMNVDAHTQILAAATFLPQHIPHLPLSPAVWHSMPSFTQRKGSGYIFHQPSSVQGYLSQMNQWARTIFEWDIQEIKPDHTNSDGSTKKYFIATPIFNEETLYEFQATGYTIKSAKEAASECMVKRDFCNKASSKLYIFYPPSSFEGYLAQIHKWARTVSLTWDCQEIKPDHTTDGPTKRYFIATPIFLEERLHLFADKGKTKQAAKEAASKLMAESGYC